jgi:hypothetical protein
MKRQSEASEVVILGADQAADETVRPTQSASAEVARRFMWRFPDQAGVEAGKALRRLSLLAPALATSVSE